MESLGVGGEKLQEGEEKKCMVIKVCHVGQSSSGTKTLRGAIRRTGASL